METDNQSQSLEQSQEQTQSQDQSSQVQSQETQINQGQSSANPVEQTPAPWQPSYKYKVKDKEMEFDDFIKKSIKDQEQEKKIKELYEKASGLDLAKPKLAEYQSKYTDLESKHTALMDDVKYLGEAIRTGDLDTAFNSLKMDEKAVFTWVQNKLNEYEMPEQQRNQLYQQRQEAQRAKQLESQNAILQQNWEKAQMDMRERELDLALNTAGNIAKEYEAKYGAGSFRNEVIMLGAIENQMGRDPSAAELVQMAVKKYSPFFQQSIQASQPGQPAPQGQKVATLPNISGQSVSAARSKVKSLDDLRRRAAELE